MLLEIMIGHATVYPCPFHDKAMNEDRSDVSLRIGWLGDWGGSFPCEDGILEACASSLRGCLGETTHSFELVLRPLFPLRELWKAWVTIRSAVITENVVATLRQQTGLDRDSVYGFVTQQIDNDNEDAVFSNQQSPSTLQVLFKTFCSPVRWEIQRGIRVSEEDLIEANRIASAWTRTLELDVFSKFDFLALPSSQVWPFPKTLDWPVAIQGHKMSTYHEWMQVMVPASLAGLPVMTIPIEAVAPRIETQGRTIGIQLIGRRHSDSKMLQFAHDIAKRS
jgi:amidase